MEHTSLSSGSPPSTDDSDRFIVTFGPHDDNNAFSYRPDSNKPILVVGMLCVEDLDVVGIGEKYLLSLFKANAVFVDVAEILFFIPLDLHGGTLSTGGACVNHWNEGIRRSIVHLGLALGDLIMAQLPEIISVGDLRQATVAVLKRVQSPGQPVMITRRGRTAAVLLSTDAYERRERERHVLRLLVRSEQEITAGIGDDLDDVLAEADAILSRELPA